MKSINTFLWMQIRRLEAPLADTIFALLLLSLVITAGWLIARHDRYWDWTATAGNSLTPESQSILKRLDAPLRATVFADEMTPLGKAIGRLLTRYQQTLTGMEVRYLDPQLFPERARDAEVSLVGQVLIEYRGRRETLKEISERSITTAIAHLTETRSPWVAVIEGHGERGIDGTSGSSLGRLGQELRDQGFLARPLDLTAVREVPQNTQLIVLSNPGIPLFPGEIDNLSRYLDRGGNLLWLMDPGPLNGLEPIAERLGLTILPGTVVDSAAAKLGAETPAVAVISEYPDDSFSGGLRAPAVMPGTQAFDTQVAPGWALTSFLTTGDQSWNETGRVEGTLTRDEVVGEFPGPLAVVLALTRPLPDTEGEQRVLIVGDGDFLSNAQWASHGNRALGLRMFRWLSSEETLPELPPIPAAAEAIDLGSAQRTLIGLGALAGLPGIFIIGGLAMRWHRWRGR